MQQDVLYQLFRWPKRLVSFGCEISVGPRARREVEHPAPGGCGPFGVLGVVPLVRRDEPDRLSRRPAEGTQCIEVLPQVRQELFLRHEALFPVVPLSVKGVGVRMWSDVVTTDGRFAGPIGHSGLGKEIASQEERRLYPAIGERGEDLFRAVSVFPTGEDQRQLRCGSASTHNRTVADFGLGGGLAGLRASAP